MMKKAGVQRTKVPIVVVMAVTMLSSSCATMFHGSTETIYVRSEEADTRFFLNQRDLGTGTSAVASVPKKDLSKTMLRASKDGCHDKATPIETQFDAITLLGVLLDWGIVSILLVDWAATGAVTMAAQSDYVITPECPKPATLPVM